MWRALNRAETDGHPQSGAIIISENVIGGWGNKRSEAFRLGRRPFCAGRGRSLEGLR